jgi:CO/xanthine dehydrogenase Mo-binding subunit
VTVSRRRFVSISALAAGGLVIATRLPRARAAEPTVAPGKPFTPNAWVTVTPDDRVILVIDRVEMGQGTITSHATLLAEELEVDPAKVEIALAGPHQAYDNPELGFQMTGGSSSVKTSWKPLREAGAMAREMLKAAAAKTWRLDVAACSAREGAIEGPGGRRARYGELTLAAARLHRRRATLKDPKDWKLIGRSLHRLDVPDKVAGRAVFGIDVKVPGCLTAVVVRCPVPTGKLKTVNDAVAKAMPGVVAVVAMPAAVGVVATGFWQAKTAALKLEVAWDLGPRAELDSAGIRERWRKLALEDAHRAVRKDGNFARAFEEARKAGGKILEAEYGTPFLAHAPMEPQNCTASVKDGRCEVWAPTQSPSGARDTAQRVTGFSEDRITVHQTLIGGSFGRRISQDWVAEAVFLSAALQKPVKVIWTREDDLRHDRYRPASHHRLQAALDGKGTPVAWRHRIVTPSILAQIGADFASDLLPLWLGPGVRGFAGQQAKKLYASGTVLDGQTVEGAKELEYAVPNVRVELNQDEPGVPVGYWRSVGHSSNAFVKECFVDELAHAAGEDPVAFRLRLLSKEPRNRAVLELAAAKAGWGTPPPPGRARGVAQHHSFDSWVAQVAEVSVQDGAIRVHRVVAAIDCGRVVNPDVVRAQVEGAVIFGLSAALKGKITFEHGRVVQGNFNDYEILRLHEIPEVEVHLVPSEEPPTGVGEPGVPPIAPAVGNALFALTGKRLRELPFALNEEKSP